ncbi:epoxyqueuosine reductase QueH [Ruminococcaceae bacterium OttesenSCG-928-I18]|nr:epoxyqueuosine reductase QueH [Ruminococcaceae bacterium OttesenSCG-928-I18]
MDYNRKMEDRIRSAQDGTPLFLHACCAPCASSAVERLGHRFSITLFYYNPNLWPREEYEKRLAAFTPLLERAKTAYPLTFEAGPYHSEAFSQLARPLAGEPEGGRRCAACFAFRLRLVSITAAKRGFPLVGTTLTVGPRKNAALVNETGAAMAAEQGIEWLPADLKKKDGYRRSVMLSEEYGLYRQGYCGCEYSLPKPAAPAQAER